MNNSWAVVLFINKLIALILVFICIIGLLIYGIIALKEKKDASYVVIGIFSLFFAFILCYAFVLILFFI